MALLDIPDPWHDETAHRVDRAKRMLMAMRGENEIEKAHFPERRRGS